jgi:hypothetical protein
VSPVPDEAGLKLQALANDVFGVFSVASGVPFQAGFEYSLYIQLSGAASRSVFADPFIEAVLADPQLAEIFEFRGDDPNERKGIVYALTIMRPRYLTSGFTLSGQVAVLPGQLIMKAANQCLADNDTTQLRFVVEAGRALAEFRSLVAGRSVAVPFYVGLSGIKLAANVEVPTPWGTIRHLRSGEDHLFPLAPPEVRVVLRGAIEVRVIPGDHEKVIARGPGAAAQESVDLMARKAALALAFTVDRDPPLGVATSWSMLFAHLMSGGISVPGFRSGLVSDHELTAAEAVELQGVASLVEERYCDQIDLAVRRCLSALGRRSDPVDCLIDAMISLESLTQQDVSGVTFQLAASMAVLFGKTVAERELMFGRMKKLYGIRSKVVHGSDKPLSHVTVVESALETAKLALHGLQVLFFDRPELLASDQRGRDIVLGTSL